MRTYNERTRCILEKAEIQKRKNRTRIKLISIFAGVAAALIAFNLVLFVPYTVGDANISEYKSSEYYNVIQKLYGLTYSPRKTNNFKEWFGNLFKSGANGNNGLAGAPSGAGSDHSSGNSYQETTLNQTEGVTEGDLFKRSDTHIFYLGFTYGRYDIAEDHTNGSSQKYVYSETSYNLRVYTIAGEDSRQVAEYTIMPDKGTSFQGYIANREMYLSEDLSTVTVISPCYDEAAKLMYTVVINIDVSDPLKVKEKSRTYVTGSYVSSRVVDGRMLLISDFRVRDNVDFDSLPQYVPHVGKRGKMKPLFADDIVCPKDVAQPRYTVICSLDSELDVTDKVALLSFSDDVYVSQNNLFATRTYNKGVYTHNEYDLYYAHNMTEIRIVPYDKDGTFGKTRSVDAAGSVLNRYSLDEYDGTLRAVTTIRFSETGYSYMGDNPYKNAFGNRCMLYCYDLDTLEVTAKVTDFAPVGESVMSARFYGDTAYICTAEVRYAVNTDPVFAFDLSDLDNITYTDTGTITGYSMSLNNFAFDTLLGIGYGEDRRTLKIELYEQTGTDVASVAKYEQNNVSFSQEFKAHLIDADNGIVGLGVSYQSPHGAETRYVLLRYDGYNLTELASVEMGSSLFDHMRATVIDGYVYILETDGSNKVKDIKAVKVK